jgi:predicted nucleic-acid-binding protein
VKKYIIDTNVLISFVTDRNLSQQEIVAPLFVSASKLKCTLVCHQFALTEFVFVMTKVYGTAPEAVNSMIRDLTVMPGIEVYQLTDFQTLLKLWPVSIPDFGDAVIATTAKTVEGATIVTFDAKFKSALKKLGINSF